MPRCRRLLINVRTLTRSWGCVVPRIVSSSSSVGKLWIIRRDRRILGLLILKVISSYSGRRLITSLPLSHSPLVLRWMSSGGTIDVINGIWIISGIRVSDTLRIISLISPGIGIILLGIIHRIGTITCSSVISGGLTSSSFVIGIDNSFRVISIILEGSIFGVISSIIGIVDCFRLVTPAITKVAVSLRRIVCIVDCIRIIISVVHKISGRTRIIGILCIIHCFWDISITSKFSGIRMMISAIDIVDRFRMISSGLGFWVISG